MKVSHWKEDRKTKTHTHTEKGGRERERKPSLMTQSRHKWHNQDSIFNKINLVVKHIVHQKRKSQDLDGPRPKRRYPAVLPKFNSFSYPKLRLVRMT